MERKKFRSLAATLNHMSLDRSDVQGHMHEDDESDTGELEETEDGSQISERNGVCDVGDADTEKQDETKFDVDSDWATEGLERMASGGMMMINWMDGQWCNIGPEHMRRVRCARRKLSIAQSQQVERRLSECSRR